MPPTLVFIDKDDELVSYDDIQELSGRLNQWKLITVENKESTLKRPYHHLIISSESLGTQEWAKKVEPQLDAMLGQSNRRASPTEPE